MKYNTRDTSTQQKSVKNSQTHRGQLLDFCAAMLIAMYLLSIFFDSQGAIALYENLLSLGVSVMLLEFIFIKFNGQWVRLSIYCLFFFGISL